MTPNEKRAQQMVDALPWHGCRPMCGECRVVLDAALAAHLDAAERRGEERVLRWLTKHRLPLGVKMYTEARRARGGRRS